MPKIRKRAREFVEYAAKYYREVEWAHFDDDPGQIGFEDIKSSHVGPRGASEPDDWYNVPIWRIACAANDATGHGDLVYKSNYRSLLRDFPAGEHGMVHIVSTYMDVLAIRLDKVSRELLDVCENLLDYALYDESDHSELELDAESECWDDYGRSDLKSELSNAGYDVDDLDDLDDADAALDDAWYWARNELGIYVELEGEAAYWCGMADEGTIEFVADKLGLKREEEA